jgi:uncharacterized protein
VLVLLPASDSKRSAVLDAVVDVSATPQGPRALSEKPSMTEVIRRNTGLVTAPAVAAERLYTGVLFDAIEIATLDAAARRRSRSWVVVISALWGALHLGDRVPSYRVNMCARLPGLGHMPDVWRGPLSDVLPAAAGRGLIVDLRSSEYATAWRPTGALAERTVVVKIVRAPGGPGAVSHAAKWTRGLVVRRILIDAIDPRQPADLADALEPCFAVEFHPSPRPGRSAELHVVQTA